MQRKTSQRGPDRRSRVVDLSGQHRRVLEYIRGKGIHGATDSEIQSALKLRGDTQRPRRRELEQAGLIREAIQHRRGCKVWVAVEAARQQSLPAAGRDAQRHEQERAQSLLEGQQESDRQELAELNVRFGTTLDAMTDSEIADVVEQVPDEESRYGLRRRLDRRGPTSGFVRPWLLRLLNQQQPQ